MHTLLTRHVRTLLTGAAIAAALAAPVHAQDAPAQEPPPYKISGLVFGDYYFFPQHHLDEWEDQNGLWLRRIYFTYDHTLSPKLTARLRLEANSNGKLAGGSLEPFIKDAYLQWTFSGKQRLIAGLQPSLTMDFVEGVWGLRHVEKTPLDLYRVDSARETGFTVSGPLNSSGTVSYGAQIGNDTGSNAETDKHKGYRLNARYATNPGFSIEGFFGRSERASNADRTTMQVFGTYRQSRGRVGAQYARQTRRAADGSTADDVTLDIFSAFGVVNLASDRLLGFLRVDRFDDACADCGAIDYLPIATMSPFTLTIAGIDYALHPSVRVSPNLEWVKYDDDAVTSNDLALRLTLAWFW